MHPLNQINSPLVVLPEDLEDPIPAVQMNQIWPVGRFSGMVEAWNETGKLLRIGRFRMGN